MMTAMQGRPAASFPNRGGYTLVEAVVSSVIVGTMMVAALGTVGASRVGQYKTSQGSRGQLLAQSMMAEILSQSYREPVDVPVFGPELPAEQGNGRASYDDVDDYHGWSASPPQNKDGSEIPGLDGWRRTVTVEWVNPFDLEEVESFETSIKRITVTVSHNGMEVGSAVGVRSSAFESKR